MSSDLPEEIVDIEDEFEIDDDVTDLEARLGAAQEEEVQEEKREEDTEPREQFVIFTLGPARFCVHVDGVRRIVDVGDLTRVPRTTEAIDGIMDLRGEITAVLDPRVLFDLAPSERGHDDQEVIVFEMGRYGGHAGIRIDAVRGVEAARVSDIVLEAGDERVAGTVHAERLEHELVAALVLSEEREHEYLPVIDVVEIIETAREAVTV